ncbi:MAG: SCO family protein [Beijerinckiaceae bacterium]|nr:SCO family protein [Beijerinckiaceae bacterium]
MIALAAGVRRLAWVVLASAATLMGHEAAAHDTSHVKPAAIPSLDPLANRFGGPFSLIDHTGTRVSDADFRGRYMLVYFGFTHCGDTCPIDLALMGQALDTVGPAVADRIQPIFISVDPEVDTPKVLADYVVNFHPRLVGLTGSLAEISAAAKAYRVQRHKILHQATNGHPYFIDHGSLMFLMGPDGAFVSLFPHNSSAEKIAESLKTYVR